MRGGYSKQYEKAIYITRRNVKFKKNAVLLTTRRGSPVDDRPSTDKHHNFVRKKKKKCDTWHVTCDM